MKIVAALPNLLRRLARPLLILSVAFGAPAALFAVGAWVLANLGTPGRSAGKPLGTTEGQKYAIEGWTNDIGPKPDGFGANPLLTFTDNAKNPNGNPGQFAIGTLTAGGAGSVEIGLAGSASGGVPGPGAMEIQPLVAVPEPGGATLVVLGGLGILLLRRKSGAA